jgi:hypothetical protein
METPWKFRANVAGEINTDIGKWQADLKVRLYDRYEPAKD